MFYRLTNFVLVVAILFAGYQLSYGENLKCTLDYKTYYNWGSIYSCNVNSLDNGNNDKVMTGFVGSVSNGNYVKMIHVSGTTAKYIPANIGKLFKLTSFYFGSSQLRAIKSEDFAGMENIERLELGRNILTLIPADAFSTLPKLRYLSMYRNRIQELPVGIFSKNVNLKELWLSKNQIKFIASGVFDGLTQINDLEINDNDCVSKKYTGITEVRKDMKNICKEPLTTSAQYLIDEISQLRKELLQANDANTQEANEKLSNCEKDQQELLNKNKILIKQSTSFNIVCEFKQSYEEYCCVTQDLVINQKYLELNEVIGQHLELKSNDHLTDLIVSTTSMLYLSNNIFKTFPALQTIKIYNSMLRQLSKGDFKSATKINFFLAQGNEMKTLDPNIFEGAEEHLTNIQLESNRIENISIETFNGLNQLKVLSLKSNWISELQLGTFKDAVLLETLILTANKIKFLDGKLIQFNTQLKNLAIDQNELLDIGADFLNYAVNLTYYNFNENTCIVENTDKLLVNELIFVIKHCCKKHDYVLDIYNCGHLNKN